jgi:hypothetical protein
VGFEKRCAVCGVRSAECCVCGGPDRFTYGRFTSTVIFRTTRSPLDSGLMQSNVETRQQPNFEALHSLHAIGRYLYERVPVVVCKQIVKW